MSYRNYFINSLSARESFKRSRFFSFAARQLIRVYQKIISPFVGNHCRFFPSCSDYADESILRFGFFRGIQKTFGRILRCHPFHPGGHDPVL